MGIKRTDRRLQASMTEFFKAQDHNNGLMTEQDFKGLLLNVNRNAFVNSQIFNN
jgi:hypothetical protein